MIEIPVKYEKRDSFRKELAGIGGRVVNVVELRHCEHLLFIVDPGGTDEKRIMDAGFKTFLSDDGLKLFEERYRR